MFSYLVTFHMNNGLSYRTRLIGEDSEDIKRKVFEELTQKDGFAEFKMKDNPHVFFTIILENVSCIEYEMLSEEEIVPFDELGDLPDDALAKLFEHMDNDYIIGIALIHADEPLKDRFLSLLSESRRTVVEETMKLELGKIKMNDVLSARREITSLIGKLYGSGNIEL